MRRVLLFAIRCYQRFVSPYKGFRCAYREHTGYASCSTLGYRAVRRHGIFTGLGLIKQRTSLCGVVHRRTHPARTLNPQRGVCDLGCDLPCDGGCDLPSGRSLLKACDYLSVCDCGNCDWPSRNRKKRGEEKYVYIPPKGSRQTPP